MGWKKCILFCGDYGHGKALLTNIAIKAPAPHIRHHSDFGFKISPGSMG